MLCMSFGIVSFDAASEEITGPFVSRLDGFPKSYLLDQYATDATSNGLGVSSVFWCSQTVTAGISGMLEKISFYYDGATGEGNLVLRIYSVVSGKPSTPLNAPTYISSVGLTLGVKNIFLVDPIYISQDTQYAIVMYADNPSLSYSLKYHMSNPYPGGTEVDSTNAGASWDIFSTNDLYFETYVSQPMTISKIAWHESGGQAWGVTGDSEHVYAYSRDSGTWSTVFSAVSGDIFHDIVYDDVRHMFYIVGESGGWPIAFTWDGTNGFLDLGSPPAIMGIFFGVEPCYGYGDYYFLAVGRGSSGEPMAAWYNEASGFEIITDLPWVQATFFDATWDYNNIGSFYMVGQNFSGGTAMLYRLDNPGDPMASDMGEYLNLSETYSFKAIDWCPDFANHDYALIVGSGSIAAAWKIEMGVLSPLVLGFSGTLEDVNWFPDGSEAIIVGSEGAVYRHIVSIYTAIDLTGLANAGGTDLYGVACKGPSSPSSAIITGTGGGISFYPSALNQNTQITVNAAFPHLYWIGFNDTAHNPKIEQQVAPDGWYEFSFAGNYSQGWSNCEVNIRAWYDQGNVGDLSVYPPETAASRCLAMNITYDVGAMLTSMTFPTFGLPEANLGAVNDVLIPGGPVGQEMHYVTIAVFFGIQARAAHGNGFSSGDTDTGPSKNSALLDANSWDFNVTLRDKAYASASQTLYSEFGMNKMVTISVTGNPTGSAPPGASDVHMSNPSQITYSSNSAYWVNVSIPNVGLNGNPLAADFISPTDVSVANSNNLASSEYTEMNLTDCPTGRAFQGVDVPLCVWGNRTAVGNPYMPAPANGTTAFGPWGSNYNYYGNPSGTTQLDWWVTVQAPTKEGVYSAIITVTVDA